MMAVNEEAVTYDVSTLSWRSKLQKYRCQSKKEKTIGQWRAKSSLKVRKKCETLFF